MRNKLCCLSKLFTLLFILPVFLYAQNDKIKNGKVYKARVYCDQYKVKGILYDVTDSAVVIYSESKYVGQAYDTIAFDKIKKIYLLRRGSGGIGFGIGAAASIGRTILLVAGEDDEESQQTDRFADIIVGIFLAPIVGTVGAVIGVNSGKSFRINCDYNHFQSIKNQLSERTYLKN